MKRSDGHLMKPTSLIAVRLCVLSIVAGMGSACDGALTAPSSNPSGNWGGDGITMSIGDVAHIRNVLLDAWRAGASTQVPVKLRRAYFRTS